MSDIDALMDDLGADRVIADAWPGAKWCGARWMELADDVELKAHLRDDLASAVVVNGAIVRRAMRSGEFAPFIDAMRAALALLADHVAELGHMDAMMKLDPDPRIK